MTTGPFQLIVAAYSDPEGAGQRLEGRKRGKKAGPLVGTGIWFAWMQVFG